MRKNPSSCDCTEIRTHVPTSEGFEVTNGTIGGATRALESDILFMKANTEEIDTGSERDYRGNAPVILYN